MNWLSSDPSKAEDIMGLLLDARGDDEVFREEETMAWLCAQLGASGKGARAVMVRAHLVEHTCEGVRE